ncbi:MAG: GntR family transcriptional regulator [Spirochaetia bacterium]
MPLEKINKDPIYQQLNGILRRLLASDEFTIGGKFLTERAICGRFEVSRATANKALSNLVSEGLLEFKKGVGTFLKSKPPEEDVQSLASFTRNAIAAGKVPTTRILNVQQTKGCRIPSTIAAVLEVAGTDGIYVVERLRLADGVPMILEHRFIVARHCPDLDLNSLEGSLYALFTEKYNLHIIGSEETMSAVTITHRAAKLLGVKPGKAGLLVTAIGYIVGEVPLWYERTLHRPDGWEFRCRVTPTPADRKLQERMVSSKRQSRSRSHSPYARSKS